MAQDPEEVHPTLLSALEHARRENDEKIRQLERKNAELDRQIAILRSPIPVPGICVDCWVDHGEQNALEPNAGLMPRGYEMLVCPKCGSRKLKEG